MLPDAGQRGIVEGSCRNIVESDDPNAKKTMTRAQLTEAEREVRERITKMHAVEHPISAKTSSAYERSDIARIS